MRIAVCVKHVPDAQSDRRFEDGRLVRGEDDTLNELDEFAVEAAVSLVEDHGGEVVALTMGPDGSDEAVMRALQMGADRGVHLLDDRLENSDAATTATALAAVVATLEAEAGAPFDLVITGMASLDGMTSLVPAGLAARLARPFLGLAQTLDVDGGDAPVVRVTRSADGFEDVLEAPAPLVLSVTDQLNEPRYPSFKTMKAARLKPLDEWSLDDVADHLPADFPGPVRLEVLDISERERPAGTIVTDSGDAGERLAQWLLQEVK